MATPIDAQGRMLLVEYRRSVQVVESLDPSLPKVMHDIRAMYRDYLRDKLVEKGLIVDAMK